MLPISRREALARCGTGLGTLALAGLLATVAAVTAFGLLDLARPEGQRAHLGRLFERVGNEGLEPLLSIVERKAAANVEVHLRRGGPRLSRHPSPTQHDNKPTTPKTCIAPNQIRKVPITHTYTSEIPGARAWP